MKFETTKNDNHFGIKNQLSLKRLNYYDKTAGEEEEEEEAMDV